MQSPKRIKKQASVYLRGICVKYTVRFGVADPFLDSHYWDIFVAKFE